MPLRKCFLAWPIVGSYGEFRTGMKLIRHSHWGGVTALLLGGLLTFPVAAAELIGFNFNVNGASANVMSSSDVAGAPGVRQGNWNAVTGSVRFTNVFKNQNGVSVPGMSLLLNLTGGSFIAQRFVGGANDPHLFGDVIDQFPNSPTTITLTGIPYTNYSIYFYVLSTEVGSGSGNTRGGFFALTNSASTNVTMRYLRNQDNSFTQLAQVDSNGNGYVPGETTVIAPLDSWSSVQGGNYVRVTGLTNSSLTAIVGTIGGSTANKDVLGRSINNGSSVARLKFAGFQIVEEADPGWNTAAFSLPDAKQDQPYSGSLAFFATPQDGSLSFSKVTGPGWLNVDPNGALSGTPLATDVGTNEFVLQVTDGSTFTNDATVALFVKAAAANSVPIELTSPDGRLVLTFGITNFGGSAGCPTYSVSQTGRVLVATSKLGLTFGVGQVREVLTNYSHTITTNFSVWNPVWGEREVVTNHYHELVVRLQEVELPLRLMDVTFRAYNEGVAFCYTVPEQPGFTNVVNLSEQSEFRFAANHPIWSTTSAQGTYAATTLNSIPSGCERPLPVQVETNVFLALGEARLVDFARMKFGALGVANSIVSQLSSGVTAALPLTTPWRFILVADSPGGLLEQNHLVLNLNDPCAIEDTSWIKPGKVLRDVSLSTTGAVACIDYAVKHNIEYLLFDAGWYGPEATYPTATNVNVDPARSPGPLDLQYVIDYGASNNVGVILYVNWKALTNGLEVLPALYESWGVKGIKFGFVNVGAQQWTAIVNEAVRRFATNHIMVDIHDEFRLTGYERTYPNLMTVEGIRGDEATPSTSQDVTTLFSRMLCGPGDHTVCYFNTRVAANWSYAHQLAKAVCFFSPLQFIHWYDVPTNSPSYTPGNPTGNSMITETPELEFFDYLPASWHETRVLEGSMGNYAIIARRNGENWYVGAMNAGLSRNFNVPLSFLPPGAPYIANVYVQDTNVNTRTQVRIDRVMVDSTTVLPMSIAPSDGIAVRLTPATPPEVQSLEMQGGQAFSLIAAGNLGVPYSLWTSTNVALPMSNWSLLSTGSITATPFTNADLTVSNVPQKFYRYSSP